MENESLTTAPEEEQVEVNNEATENEEQQVEESTTGAKSYDDAWDSLELDNVESVDKLLSEADKQQTEEQHEETQVNEETTATEAFMKAAPVLKFKGKDVPIDSPDEIIALAQKGFLMESEMSKLKPQKKIINTVSDVPLEVLQAVADLNQGKQEALEYLKSHYGIEDNESDDYNFEYDNDESEKKPSTYQPEVKPEDPVAEYWEAFSQEDPTTAAAVLETHGQLDPGFQNAIHDPAMFPAFVESVRTGEFEKVYPIAVKERILNPALDWITAYQTAAGKVGAVEQRNEPPKSAQQPKAVNERSIDPKSTADDIWENDEAFERMQREIFQG